MSFARSADSAPSPRHRAPFGRPVTAAAYALLTVCALLAPAFVWPESPADPGQAAEQASAKQIKEDTKHAEQEADRADQAAADGKIEQALAGYIAATKIAPGDLNIRQRAAALRAQVVQKIVGEAETAALDGDIEKATDRLVAALRIDPGNTILAERLAEMKQMQPTYLPRGDASDYELKGAAKVHPQPGKKSVNVRGDAKSAYEQVAGMFGIKATFDPDLPSRNVKLQADGLDFYTAMQLLGAEARAFYRVVNSTLIFVAADTIEKRKEYAEEVQQTFPVDSTLAPEDLTEMMRVIREITNVTRINMDSKTHSLVLRDSADKVALAGELIKELNQARRDVMLDFELLEVDSTEARNLGITPPSSTQAIPLNSQTVAQLDQASNVTNLLTLISQVFQTQGITASPTDIFPVGGGRSTFLLTMPSATANFSEALSLVRSGREFWMRAQDGKPATFFAGERFPITLSLLSASLGSTVIGGAVTPTTFARTDFAVGNDPVAVVAQDFNNDQQKDLAVVNQADSSISILINQGNGNFKPTAGSPLKLGTNEQSPAAIASAIFRLTDATHLVQPADLVVANSGSNTVSVLLGSENFDGTFTEATGSPFAVGTRPSAVIIADLNGDGFLDIAVANETDNTISTFQGDGQGNFVPFPKSPFALPAAEKGPIAMASGTFDNSGKPEFAVLSATTENIGIYQATGDSTFNGTFAELEGSPIGTGSDPVAFAAGDLNADGFSDLAVVNQSASAITVLLNDGTGVFTQAAGSPLATASTPAGVAIADFTNSGFGDIAVTNNGSATLGVYAGLGSGTFSQNIQLSVPPGPLAVIAADVNGDGLPDAILTATSTSGNFVTVLLDPTQFASGGGNIQTPYPGSEYEDIGLKVKATPVLHDNDEVTLQLEFEIRSLAGTSVNGIPVITNRTLSQTVRLRENQTSIIAGLLDREETNALSGIPGFAALPGLGYAFGTKNKNYSNTELLFLVTPRRMRDRIRATRARYIGQGGGGGSSGAPPAEP
jgi:Bacterial type II and III secretion system protein/FG-GAP-like repeat